MSIVSLKVSATKRGGLSKIAPFFATIFYGTAEHFSKMEL